MMLLEDEGKRLFRDHHVPVPLGRTITAPDQLADMGGPVIIKALVPTGGRGKAGGVVQASNKEEAEREVRRILQMTISGHHVRSVLVEEVLDISREIYLSILIDRSMGTPAILIADRGGVDVEALPEGAVRQWPVHPFLGIGSYRARDVAAALGLNDREKDFHELLDHLWELFVANDCELVEINPLVLTKGGELVAADCKMVINDDALFRHPELAAFREVEDVLESEARENGIAFVRLDGDVGVIANGAGLTMATLDELALSGRTAGAFMDLGGTDDPGKVEVAYEIMARSGPKVILLNIFGGITRCDTVAEGVLRAMDRQGGKVPVVARIRGVNETRAREMLRAKGIAAHMSLEDAVRDVVELGGKA
jgi:succinyl-CoA synthetase beta subunit